MFLFEISLEILFSFISLQNSIQFVEKKNFRNVRILSKTRLKLNSPPQKFAQIVVIPNEPFSDWISVILWTPNEGS